MTRAKSPARLRRYHHGDLRSALLAAAGRLLERDGAEALSFRAVARAAGVSQAAPYNHFAEKDELLATLAEAGFRELTTSQAAAAARATPGEERMVALGKDYIRFATARPQLFRLMFGVGVADWCRYPQVAEAKQATFAPIRAALVEYLGAATPPATLEAAAIAGWGLVHGLSTLRIAGSAADQPSSRDLKRESAALRLFAQCLGSRGALSCPGDGVAAAKTSRR